MVWGAVMAYLIVPGIGERMRDAYRRGRLKPNHPMPTIIPEQSQSYYPVPAINTPSFYSTADGCIEWWHDGRMFFTD